MYATLSLCKRTYPEVALVFLVKQPMTTSSCIRGLESMRYENFSEATLIGGSDERTKAPSREEEREKTISTQKKTSKIILISRRNNTRAKAHTSKYIHTARSVLLLAIIYTPLYFLAHCFLIGCCVMLLLSIHGLRVATQSILGASICACI